MKFTLLLTALLIAGAPLAHAHGDRNEGRMRHEVVIGTSDELAKHAALMAKFPNMEHDAPYMAHVSPGQSGEIVWHFNRAGSFEFACLIAGHYEAGMRGTLTVTPKQGAAK